MALSGSALAKILWDVLSPNNATTGATDPTPNTHMKNYSNGFVKMITTSKITHLVESVAGSAPPGSPLSGGTASAGKIVGVLGPTMAAEIAKGGNPVISAGAQIECAAIAAYIMEAAKVTFPAGTIYGKSTATGSSPGPLVPDPSKPSQGGGGRVSGLVGSALSKRVTQGQEGPKKVAFYTALCNYLMSAGIASYPNGTVNGTCTPGGKLTLGIGVGGGIS